MLIFTYDCVLYWIQAVVEAKDAQLQQKDTQLQHKDGQIQRQATELRERTLQLNRQLREVQTLRVRKLFLKWFQISLGQLCKRPWKLLSVNHMDVVWPN